MKKGKHLFHFLFGVLFSLLNNFLLIFLGTFLAKRIGAEDYGDFSVALSISSFFYLFATLGLSKLALREIPIYQNQKKWSLIHGYISKSIQLILITSVIVVLTFSIGYALYRILGNEHHPVILAILFIPIMGLVLFFIDLFNTEKDFILSTIIYRLQLPLSALALIILFTFVGNITENIAIILYGFAWLGCLFTIIFFSRKKLGHVFSVKESYETSHWLKSSLPLLLNFIIFLSLTQIGILSLEIMYPSEMEVGIFGAVLNLFHFILTINATSTRLFSPQIAKTLSTFDKKAFRKLLREQFLFIGILSLFFLIFVAFFGNFFLSLYGPFFSEGYSSLVVLTLFNLIGAPLSIGPIISLYMGHRQQTLISNFAVLGGTLLLCFPLTHAYGIMGAVLGSSIPAIFYYAYHLVLILRFQWKKPVLVD